MTIPYLVFLGNRYSPPEINPFWLENVVFYVKQFGGDE